jgi:hypothetical protein
VGQSLQQIVDWVENATPAIRITDLSIYTVGGTKYYSAVAVYNQGAQYQGWWWYFDKTEAEIAALLTQNSARLIDIELETAPSLFNGARFAAVMVAQNPGGGWFDASSTGTQTGNLIGQTGGRLTSLHRYTTALGTTAYAVSSRQRQRPDAARARLHGRPGHARLLRLQAQAGGWPGNRIPERELRVRAGQHHEDPARCRRDPRMRAGRPLPEWQLLGAQHLHFH